jgi:hypothetical protein
VSVGRIQKWKLNVKIAFFPKFLSEKNEIDFHEIYRACNIGSALLEDSLTSSKCKPVKGMKLVSDALLLVSLLWHKRKRRLFGCIVVALQVIFEKSLAVLLPCNPNGYEQGQHNEMHF